MTGQYHRSRACAGLGMNVANTSSVRYTRVTLNNNILLALIDPVSPGVLRGRCEYRERQVGALAPLGIVAGLLLLLLSNQYPEAHHGTGMA